MTSEATNLSGVGVRRNEYDSADGIARNLHNLADLRTLIELRREAGYGRKERMAEFVIMGTWVLDTCGNCGKLQSRVV